MAEALRNLGAGLGRTLEDANYDVWQDDGTDPGIAVMNSADEMEAAEKAAEIGLVLSEAQAAINRLGYNRPPPQHGDQVIIELPDRTTPRGTWQHVEGRDPYLLDDDGTERRPPNG